MNHKKIPVSLTALFVLASVFAFGSDKADVKGIIVARTGETVIVKSADQNVTVVLTDHTVTKERQGAIWPR